MLTEIFLQIVITLWKKLPANKKFSVTSTVMPKDSRKYCVIGAVEAVWGLNCIYNSFKQFSDKSEVLSKLMCLDGQDKFQRLSAGNRGGHLRTCRGNVECSAKRN